MSKEYITFVLNILCMIQFVNISCLFEAAIWVK